MAAPRHSFSYNMTARPESLGLDCEAKELTCLSAASRVRFAASCSAVERPAKRFKKFFIPMNVRLLAVVFVPT
eukprot:4514421-Pyramimonas_sp.AAC.1